MQKAAFLDRDGVINIDHAYVSRIEDFDFVDGVLEAARALADAGYALVVVTNQSGIGRGYYTEADFWTLTNWMKDEFKKAGAPLAGVYFCPHHPEKALDGYRQACGCRKPEPGMLLEAAHDLNLDLSQSLMFGDKPGDVEAGLKAGCRAAVILGKNGTEPVKPCENATAQFPSLLAATQSDWFKAL